MAINRGKQWEDRFNKDFLKTINDSIVIRLPDQVSRYKGHSSNICDFICYKYPIMFLIECKTVKKNGTFSITSFSQYESLLVYKDIKGVAPYVIIWFQEYDKVLAVRINDIEKMKDDGKKSVNVKMLNNDDKKLYNIIDIPFIKKRVFLECDYNIVYDKEVQVLNE